jgi:hypothetical protein
VSCDSSVCMGNPERSPMFDRACLRMQWWLTLGFCWALLGDLWASVPFCQASLLRAGLFSKAYLRVGRTQTSAIFRFVTLCNNVNLIGLCLFGCKNLIGLCLFGCKSLCIFTWPAICNDYQWPEC